MRSAIGQMKNVVLETSEKRFTAVDLSGIGVANTVALPIVNQYNEVSPAMMAEIVDRQNQELDRKVNLLGAATGQFYRDMEILAMENTNKWVTVQHLLRTLTTN